MCTSLKKSAYITIFVFSISEFNFFLSLSLSLFYTSQFHSACACVSLTSANLHPMHPAQDKTGPFQWVRQCGSETLFWWKLTVYWRWSIISYVHMKPHVVLFTYVCNFIDGIKGSVDGGTSSGIYEHRDMPLHTASIKKKERKKTLAQITGWIQLMFFFSLSLLTSKRWAKTYFSNNAFPLVCSYCWGKIARPFLLVCTSLYLWRITVRRGTLDRQKD